MTEVRNPEELLKAYEKAKADLVSLREALKEIEAEKDALAAQRDDFESKIEAYNAEKLNAAVLKTLKEQNVRDPESLIKYMDLSKVKNSDGKIEGIDEAIKEVKNDFPERFIPRKAAAGTNIDAREQKPVVPEPATGTEAQIARIFGN